MKRALEMESNAQRVICKEIIKACMWGHMGIASCIFENLDERLPREHSWQELARSLETEARHEAVGVVTTEEEVGEYLNSRYRLTNYSPGELKIFWNYRGGGLHKYIVGPLAEKYGKIHDPWNFGVYERRRALSDE